MAEYQQRIDFGQHIEAVAREVLGEPNPHQSTESQLRFGSHGSIAVEIAGEKRGTWFDHEAMEGGGVLDLLRVKKGLVNGAALDFLRRMGIGIETKPGAKTARRIVETYDYTDEAGKLLFQVVRYEPKDFRQRRPDGRGGWIWSVKGTRMVPFNLPAVLEADTVYVVEGEKDALNLGKLGLTATTNPGGASKPDKPGKWPADFARYFAGKNVVVIGDNDEAGRPHVEHVVKNLTGTAARVVALELPNLPYKGDVTNWIEAGGTAEELEWLVERASSEADAQPRNHGATAAQLSDFLSAGHWRERQIELPEPLLGELIVNTTRMFIGGPTGLGKTNFIMGMAGGMAAGTGFLHWQSSRPARVLMVDGEMPRDLVQERLADLARRMGVEDVPNLFVFCREDAEELAERFPDLGEMQPLNTEKGREWLLRLIDMLGGIDVVIFDNRMSLLSGDMKDEVPWTDTMPLVKELTKRRIAQIWVDHTGHDTGRIYGTKTKEWSFDVVAIMEKAEHATADISFSLSFTKARRRKPSNRADFEPVSIALTEDQWEGATGAQPLRNRSKPPSPKANAFHNALVNAMAHCGTKRDGRPSVTMEEWRSECRRMGLLDGADNTARALFSKYRMELVTGGWAACNNEVAWSTRC